MAMTIVERIVKTEMLQTLNKLQGLRDDHEKLEEEVMDYGICSMIHDEVDMKFLSHEQLERVTEAEQDFEEVVTDTLYALFETWEDYSGDRDYPIVTSKEPNGCYLYGDSSCKEMWIEGEQAELRWGLVDHMVVMLKEELEV